MATKEFREFFLRNTVVNSGSKLDQQIGYPTTYVNTAGTLVFNRFLKDNYPSEDVFKKLFESLTFKLNPEDTATETQQGIAKLATDSEAVARTLVFGDNMTRVLRPHQIPYISVPNATLSLNETTTTVSGRTVKVFELKDNTLLLSNSTENEVGPNVSNIVFTNKTITFAIGSLSVGDVLNIKATGYYNTLTPVNNNPGATISFGLRITPSVGSSVSSGAIISSYFARLDAEAVITITSATTATVHFKTEVVETGASYPLQRVLSVSINNITTVANTITLLGSTTGYHKLYCNQITLTRFRKA